MHFGIVPHRFSFQDTLYATALLNCSASAEGWTCSASGMVSGSYDEGSSPYIYLTGFPSGGTYTVQKNGKRSTGTTKNGTKFVCVTTDIASEIPRPHGGERTAAVSGCSAQLTA
jgi:hypothetical protein